MTQPTELHKELL